MTGFGRLSNYTPVKALDPGPDGIAGGSDKDDDRIITVFETGVPPDTTDYYLTNKPIGDTYDNGRNRRRETHAR